MTPENSAGNADPDHRHQVPNWRMEKIAQSVTLLLAVRFSYLLVPVFVAMIGWFGIRHINEVDNLSANTVELAKVVAVIQSETNDRERRLSQTEAIMERIMDRLERLTRVERDR